MAAVDIVAAELFYLWEKGFYCCGNHYVVGLIIFNSDGRGFEEVFRSPGAGSLWGSVKTREQDGDWVSPGVITYVMRRRDLPDDYPLRWITHPVRLPSTWVGEGNDRQEVLGELPPEDEYEGFPVTFPDVERRPSAELNTNAQMLADAITVVL